jgi:sirohydrochlorin cobaltochelatase
MPAQSGLVLFAHGARDPEWAEPFRDIARQVAASRPDLTVRLAFLEFQAPALPEAITALVAEGHREIRVAPLFMAQGGHLKKDVPVLLDGIRAAHPGLRIELLQAIGDAPELRQAIAQWLVRSSPPSSSPGNRS